MKKPTSTEKKPFSNRKKPSSKLDTFREFSVKRIHRLGQVSKVIGEVSKVIGEKKAVCAFCCLFRNFALPT